MKQYKVFKLWCNRCQKTSECFIFDEDCSYEHQDCKRCKKQCPSLTDHEIHVICPACTREILRETGLEPVGGTQAGACRWFSMECRGCKKIVTEPCEHLKNFTKME